MIIPKQKSILHNLVETLPKYGILKYDNNTDYWYISLPNEWQKIKNQFVKICAKNYLNTKWSKCAIKKAKKWTKLAKNTCNNDDNSDYRYIIKWVSPPSVVGLHITIGSSNDSNILKENMRIEFNIDNIIAFPSIHNIPININGQKMDNNGMRYYPVLWIFIDVIFNDKYNKIFKTKYPPHISIATISAKLPVKDVSKIVNKK